uniref:hypothetical protein n=1 Tax=Lachnoclostridium phocaeense TaxID=1871021 RepID=UPI0026DB75A9|nr:hypothetical protein [Lachnoclostridium phocaeense]
MELQGNGNHLIVKLYFDPDYYREGDVITIMRNDTAATCIILENKGESLRLALAVQDRKKSGRLQAGEKELTALDVYENGIELKSLSDGPRKLDIRKLYEEYKDLSSMLCEQEHISADTGGMDGQDDIDMRHEERLKDFLQLLNSMR